MTLEMISSSQYVNEFVVIDSKNSSFGWLSGSLLSL